MKKNYIFKFILLLIPVSAFTLLSFSSGNGSALSGSPGDNGNNCTQCHASTAQNSNITITTNIPVTGYEFNTEYDVTITNSGGSSRNGFQVTAEKDSDNSKVGTFISTNSATQTAASNSRIIHTSNGNNQNSWSFKWRSPSSEQGKVTFYGVSVSGNGNGSTSGDQVFLGKSASLPSLSAKDFNALAFDLYPNPASERITFQLPTNSEKATVEFYDNIGRLSLKENISSNNTKVDVNSLSTGIYIVKVVADGKIGTKKFIKK